MPAEPDEFLTVDEIAKRLKINPQTIRNWIDRGELEGLRLGARRVRVRSSELDAFIERSSKSRRLSKAAARRAYEAALDYVEVAETPYQQITALRDVAQAANELARALGR